VAASSPEPTDLVARLRAAGCVFAEEEAALISAAAPAGEQREGLLERRLAGEPLEQVLGWAEFHGMRITVAPGVFVPRRRSAVLVDIAVAAVRARTPPTVVVDLCCGTGAIGLAIAHEVPGVELHAADLDPAAVACARRNLSPDQVHEGDLYDALPDHLRERVDVLVANAPYVPTDEIPLMPPEARDHEHHLALDGGPDGLDVHRRIAAGAPRWLAPGGSLVIETSSRQAPRTAEACAAAGLRPTTITRDESTVVAAVRAGPIPSPS
jgi:release factor glutamine methyltransferase